MSSVLQFREGLPKDLILLGQLKGRLARLSEAACQVEALG